VAKHEVGHGIGFIHGGDFLNKVTVKDGDRFYDMNGDGTFNDDDFDLADGDDWDGHAESASDLMYYQLPSRTRRHPTLYHAKVLGDAYGYCVIPEPSTLVIWSLLGVLGIAIFRRRNRAA